MAGWTHAICDACWNNRREGEPVRAKGMSEPCCWCAAPTDGIYVRADPRTTPCEGKHKEE